MSHDKNNQVSWASDGFGTWKPGANASLITKFPVRENSTSWCTWEQSFLDAARFSILVQRFLPLFDLIFSNYGQEVKLLFLVMNADVPLPSYVLCRRHTLLKHHADVAVAAVWFESLPLNASNWSTAELYRGYHPVSGGGFWGIRSRTMDSTPLMVTPVSYRASWWN